MTAKETRSNCRIFKDKTAAAFCKKKQTSVRMSVFCFFICSFIFAGSGIVVLLQATHNTLPARSKALHIGRRLVHHHQNQLPGGNALFDAVNHLLGYIGGDNGLEHQCRHTNKKVQQTFFVPCHPVFNHLLYVVSHNSSLPKKQNRPCIDLCKSLLNVFRMGTDFSF